MECVFVTTLFPLSAVVFAICVLSLSPKSLVAVVPEVSVGRRGDLEMDKSIEIRFVEKKK